MSLQKEIMEAMKTAMKARDSVALQALRAVKSAILLAQTESGATEALSEEAEVKLLQKLVKQRKDSAQVYSEQGRDDLAEPELAEAAVIEKFLPVQLSEAEVRQIVASVIEQTGAESMKDMGRVMGMANKEMAGRADGKTISTIVKDILTK
jgi:uncharacterized protein YqeY